MSSEFHGYAVHNVMIYGQRYQICRTAVNVDFHLAFACVSFTLVSSGCYGFVL